MTATVYHIRCDGGRTVRTTDTDAAAAASADGHRVTATTGGDA